MPGILSHDQVEAVHNEEFKRINSRLKGLEDATSAIKSIKDSIDFIHQRLDKQEEQTSAIKAIAVSVSSVAEGVKEITFEVRDVVNILNGHNDRILTLELTTGKERMKELEDDIEDVKNKYIALDNRSGKTALKYFNAAMLAIVAAVAIFILNILSNGKIGG